MFQCSICGNKKYRHKLELGKQPIVHHLIDDKNEGYNLYDLAIVTCEKCAHLQIKKPFEEMIGAGGEDATSMSDFNDNVLKQKGINIKTFKAKRPIG